MIPLSSKLASSEQHFADMKDTLEEHEFALGGSWDYNHGSFDRYLDEAHKVWLRVPFDVISGNVDSESFDTDAKIKLGQPFVLKHVYNEGLDSDAQPRTVGSLVNQFQDPLDPDAEIESKWVDKAKGILSKVEPLFMN
ncbi:hypothetical protein Back11_29470 [Paenibacillus baekrokdamisoli]|uniref:Uncharacterized protein n=1 Tax=Paenibacillus baekrokdamisoli TaxID=1712516 RepID=A0A3G9ITM3_9BACL|nr:YugN family protein [Paenibacillus baekrokdamisoli]MBB3071184.1 hypothetical protein [Paenibacillus baekrokdamisoli]BBH21602.1 hypothetical protein Back11_29470 [Paenibacillus baekrokdamisoli]